MQRASRTLGIIPITRYPTLAFSSARATEGTLHPGDYALLYPHWYQVTARRSLQLVGKSAILARLALLTNVGGWLRDLESVLNGPLVCRGETELARLWRRRPLPLISYTRKGNRASLSDCLLFQEGEEGRYCATLASRSCK